jgi:predicted nucleic acid-binding protein
MSLQPSEAVLAWADSVHGPAAATTAVTAAELLSGLSRLPEGRRKAVLGEAIQQLINVDLGGRAYSFDLAAAHHYAAIAHTREVAGRPIAVADAQIAAICISLGAALATRNTKDFEGTGVRLIDPWQQPDQKAR